MAKPTIEPRYPHVNYQPFRATMKPIQKHRTFIRNNFAEHNYNYVNRPQTSKSFRPNTQNPLFLQKQNFRQPTTTTINFHVYPRISQDQSENYSKCKLEQAEITMKLEETENLKLQYVNNIQATTTQINNKHNSDTDLSEKITEILKGKPSFKKWCNYCRRYGHSIAECRQKQQDNQNKPQKYKEPKKSFYQYMKKDQNLPNKNIHSNSSSGKPLPNTSNHSRNQSPYNSNYRGRSPDKRNSRNSSQNRYGRSHSRNNHYRNTYSRSNSNRQNYSFDTSSHSHPRNRHYSNDRSRNSSCNRYRNYSNNRNRSYSNNRNQQHNNRSRDYSNNRSNYQRPNYNSYQNRSRDNSQKRNLNYNNRQRNYSQSPHRNNTRYPDSQNKPGSSTPKHQRQINQVQTAGETISDPRSFENTETTELQLNHINCESTDSDSDIENTLLVNMIEVENVYESVT